MKNKTTARAFGPIKTPRNRTPKWEIEARMRPAPQKCSTWNNVTEITAFILICVTLGALLGANF